MDLFNLLLSGLTLILIVVVISLVIRLLKLSSSSNNEGIISQKLEEIKYNISSLDLLNKERIESAKNSSLAKNDQILDFLQKEQVEKSNFQLQQQEKLFQTLKTQSEDVTKSVSISIEKLQASNEQKLEQMRLTVDEKLNETLTKRLDSSFKTISEQLSNVYKSLGEMKELSSGVSDLQKLLTNVKARGTWAEVQLGEILEQFLTLEQFERNVSVKANGEFVEYAVKIPSKNDDSQFVWLPIDSKFPQEDYLRIQSASERGDKEAVENAVKNLERLIKNEAAKIEKLYINLPYTTDFAILFLPTEGLYAEILRRPGLVEEIQRKNRVMICGPTTISAVLNSLRVGFRTIAIDKKASQVWQLLGATKQQYETFSSTLDKVKKKIDEAGNVISQAQNRNNIIKKKLKDVEVLSVEDSNEILGISDNLAEEVFEIAE